MIGNFIGVLFDGIAYGSLLFVISIGLSVTMGLMNFVNLAHGAFAMVGGYACVLAMTRLGVPFLATLPIAFLVSAAVGILLERTLYRRLYQATHLDQVLFSIGLVFMSIAATTYFFGPQQQPVRQTQRAQEFPLEQRIDRLSPLTGSQRTASSAMQSVC